MESESVNEASKRRISMAIIAPTLTVPLLVGAALLAAQTPQTPSTFSNAETGRVMPVQSGTVAGVNAVTIRPGETRFGTITGAALGGILGSTIGRSTRANVAGAVGGAAVGGAAGSAIQGSSRTRGVEITIDLDSGETVAVVQAGDPRDFRVGDRVRLTGNDENARVTR
jgi:outer membrane lipoprotein SlyB